MRHRRHSRTIRKAVEHKEPRQGRVDQTGTYVINDRGRLVKISSDIPGVSAR